MLAKEDLEGSSSTSSVQRQKDGCKSGHEKGALSYILNVKWEVALTQDYKRKRKSGPA